MAGRLPLGGERQPTGLQPGQMGDRGLGQLAYDKAMRILAASQAEDVALESAQLKHGLLTSTLWRWTAWQWGRTASATLIFNGDGRLTLAKWLRYGEEHAPALYEELEPAGKEPVFSARTAWSIRTTSASAPPTTTDPATLDSPSPPSRRRKSNKADDGLAPPPGYAERPSAAVQHRDSLSVARTMLAWS